MRTDIKTNPQEDSLPHSGSIKLLDQGTINQIAAGEVIENPSCIVRELLDNAVDAGARHISVRINFDEFFIEVIDDGCGIHPDDVPLAFEKHSTSKITRFEDVYCTPTLGFRGEALASLSAVSEVRIETAIKNNGEGVSYHIRGGEKGKVTPINFNRGTRIRVRDLFFNTPVRKKFLSLKKTGEDPHKPSAQLHLKPGEKRYIKQEIIRHILAHDGISFKYFLIETDSRLREKEKLEINAPAHYTLRDKILMFFKSNAYGESLEKSLLSVDACLNGFRIQGYVSDLMIREYRSDKQFLIIKNRVVRDPAFLRAVMTSYLHKIPRGAHPMIFLRVDPDNSDTVDINVHPRKMQVKFQNPQLFFDAIRMAIKQTLHQKLVEPRDSPIDYSSAHVPDTSASDSVLADPASLNERISGFQMREYQSSQQPFEVSEEEREMQRKKLFDPDLLDSDRLPLPSSSSTEDPAPPHDLPLRVLGQIAETFIVFSIGPDLFIADQHAVHERINYDRLKGELQKPDLSTQMLLVPILIEKSSGEKEAILQQKNLLDEMGFEIEEFGTDTLRINRVPAYLPEKQIQKAIDALFEAILNRPAETPLDPGSVEAQEFMGNVIARIACRMSVFGGDHLSHTAMEELIREIYDKGYVFTCPHGRPFVKKISLQEMKLFFDRGRHILGEIEN